ncbi:MAG: sporulation protein YqfD [Muribaculum sp.]|nr:sporulation protein YqfD [Muribaculum sp.]
MLDVLKYIRGYLRIRVTGFSPERFMNLCSNRDILLWDIEQSGDGYVMCISLYGFYRIRAIVKKTGTRVAILERCGLPFFLSTMRKRRIFLLGLLLAVSCWYVSTWFVWDIEITGNYRVTTDQLESFLKEQNIREGMRRDSLDIGELEKSLRRRFSLVTWTSARLDGTRLYISVKENDAPILQEGETQESGGTDLVSEFDGRVAAIVVRTGVPKVRIGDTVERGSVLVDGKIPVYNDDATLREYIFADADADIVIEHVETFQATLPFDYIEREYTGRETKQKFVRVGDGFEGKIPVESPYLMYDKVMRQGRPVLFEKLDIPVYGGEYTYREYQNVEHTYTLEQAQELLKENLMRFLQTLEEKGVQIIEKDVKIDTSGSGWTLYGEFLVQESAGQRTATDRGEEIIEE